MTETNVESPTEVVGATDWDHLNMKGGGGYDKDKFTFFPYAAATHVFRLLTKPHEYSFHYYKSPFYSGKGKGSKVRCSAANGSCQMCADGVEVVTGCYVGVINRATNTYEIMDPSPQIVKGIKALNKSKWGPPTTYDIAITVNPADKANYYSVMVEPPAPLSKEDLVIKAFVDEKGLEGLRRLCTPVKPEAVAKRLEFLNTPKQPNAQGGKPAVAQPTATASAPSATATSDGFDFQQA